LRISAERDQTSQAVIGIDRRAAVATSALLPAWSAALLPAPLRVGQKSTAGSCPASGMKNDRRRIFAFE
jgi:hypothetical protein